ncbi:MAG: wax ester/triacylglycerol synthase family O-acyltransferase [Rhodococcus sp. (in: high G+C Gram-positive bacteria)]|uniref:WS/DGAT/MGAT family O-acyltransferase n=1 Tax=Rhodococcus sp. TaxID=1831 RepID=UPI003BAEC04F
MDDNLSFLDAGFLETEDSDRHASLTIAALAIMEGPVPTHAEFLDAVAVRLAELPHGRHKVRTVPFDFSPPSWVEDPHFDLGHHLRRVALPEPGEEEALFGFVARVMGHRLDRDRPLWECWVVEGLSGGRWAALLKVHHCMADGIAGTRLLEAMCDEVEIGPGTAPQIESGPSVGERIESLVGSAASMLSPSRQFQLLASAVTAPLRIATTSMGVTKGLARLLSEMLTTSSDTSLIGPIGKQRRYCATRVRMSDIKEICEVYDVTVNDVALAAITSGLRTLLLRRGEKPDARTVRTLVPVSVRSPDDEGAIDNRVSLMLPFLPVDIEDHVEQLTTVHTRVAAHKAGREAEGGKAFTTLAEYGPFMPLAWAVRLAMRYPQHSVVAVTTNVPGPREPRHVLGREVLDVYPYVPIALRLRIGIAILSYNDRLSFGLTGDYDSTPDLPELAAAIRQGVASLLTSARLAAAVSG